MGVITSELYSINIINNYFNHLYMLQVKFDFRLILTYPILILNSLCFLALIHK